MSCVPCKECLNQRYNVHSNIISDHNIVATTTIQVLEKILLHREENRAIVCQLSKSAARKDELGPRKLKQLSHKNS